ncbi:MAG: GntR family transcriptional regulator [Sphaerochaeta sp.]|nr:GntR family transcriptional regulator [Sphaerochaeta sp.]
MQLKSDIVYQAILARINEGFWKPGGQIFSERQLSELFSVSRVTVKHAIGRLVGEGYLTYIKGRTGTFVSDRSPETEILQKPFIAIALDNHTPAFASYLLEGIHDALWKENYHTLYCNTHFGDRKIVEKLESFIRDGAKGLIFSPLLDDGDKEINRQVYLLAKEANIPLVQLDRYDEQATSSRVQCDNYSAMRDLSKRLIRLGVRRPLVLCGIQTSSTLERVSGICSAFGEQKVPVAQWTLDEHQYFTSETMLILEKTDGLTEGFDAVIGVSQTLSKAAVKIVKTRAFPAVTAGISASITEVTTDYAVIQPLYHIGYNAALLIIQHIERPSIPATSILLSAEQWPAMEG